MSEIDRVAISMSKLKLFLLILGSLVFVALGILFILRPNFDSHYEPGYVQAVGIAALTVFGLCGIYGITKLFDNRPGLILDRDGIVDNSSALALGRVAWLDIYEIRVSTISRQKFLTLMVRDPEQYIQRAGLLVRLLKSGSIGLTGSPINISANALRITLAELEKMVRDYWHRFGRTGANTLRDAGTIPAQ